MQRNELLASVTVPGDHHVAVRDPDRVLDELTRLVDRAGAWALTTARSATGRAETRERERPADTSWCRRAALCGLSYVTS